MSGRSSPRELIAIAVVATCGCGHQAPKPQADPALVRALAAQMVDNSPVPSALPRCQGAELAAPVTVTFRTLRLLAGQTFDASSEQSPWINPVGLDAPAARTLLDDKADATTKRQAAAELLAAPTWIVYRVDLVNAPMALGVKELKTGTINGRVIRYDRGNGRPACVLVFNFQNTRERTDWAISVSNKVYIDPAVAKILQDDLAAQYLEKVPRAPAPTPTPP